MLEALNKVKGVVKKLASDTNTGIIGDEKDLKRRRKVFGENTRPVPPRARIIDSICQTLRDIMWVIIGITALLSSLVSCFFVEWKAVWEGISIIIVSIFLITVIVLSDYYKDKLFVDLAGKVKEEKVPVIRGKLGAT
jgi:Ca2+-transporting ATPase